MNLLVDENIHSDIVAWLRSRQHDVVYVAEAMPSRSDGDLLAMAVSQQRVIVTDDKDFGELVYRSQHPAYGVLLIRLTTPSIRERLNRLAAIWQAIENHGSHHFIVVTDRKVRIRPLPSRP